MRTVSSALICAAIVFAPACKSDEAKSGDAAASATKDADAKDADAKGDKAGDKDDAAADGGGDDKALAKAPSGGSTGFADALALAPPSAMMAGTMDLGMLAAMPSLNQGMIAAAIQDPDAREAFETFKSCGLEMNMLRRVSFAGSDTDGEGMAIVDGPGISKRSVLDCLAKRALEKDGTVVKLTDGSGYTMGTSDKGDMVVFAIGDDRLVMTGEKWQAKVEGRIKGEGESAIDTSLKAVLPLADTSKKLWMVMGPAKDLSRELKGQPLETMVGASVWLDGNWQGDESARTFDMGVKIGMPDDAKAGAGKDFLATQYAQVKPMAGMFGLPPGLVDKVKFGTQGAAITIGLSLTAADIKSLEAVAKQMGGGGMPGGGMPGGMGGMGGKPGGM